MAIRVAVDAMGGDNAPAAVVDGVVSATLEAGGDIEVLLFGPESRVRPELDRHPAAATLPIRLVEAPDVVEMGDAPATALKTKTQSSIHLGIGAVKQGRADVFASAGNTGAVMAASLFILGRQEGISRPSVVGYFPTLSSYSVILDVGTNVDCKPEHLVQFAQMGSIYAQQVLGRENPTVGLINVGTEPGKGNEQTKAAFELLTRAHNEGHIRFVGNIEGRDVLSHAADVLVCDGFTGNIMLKLGESIATTLPGMIGREIQRLQLDEAGVGAVKKVFGSVQKRFDYEEYGGAPLLGVNGNVVIGHGSSSARATEKLVLAAADLVKGDLSAHIAAGFIA